MVFIVTSISLINYRRISWKMADAFGWQFVFDGITLRGKMIMVVIFTSMLGIDEENFFFNSCLFLRSAK